MAMAVDCENELSCIHNVKEVDGLTMIELCFKYSVLQIRSPL